MRFLNVGQVRFRLNRLEAALLFWRTTGSLALGRGRHALTAGSESRDA